MKKLIITGANGAGKSHLAAQMAAARPDVPLISFDAMKLRTGWQQKPRPETNAALSIEIQRDAWILEGGPSLLPLAIKKADALIWLDPPEYVRAWRLATRPWRHLGKTRPELPNGNVDWPLQQCRFALRSLKNSSQFRRTIRDVFQGAMDVQKWHCRRATDLQPVSRAWAEAAN